MQAIIGHITLQITGASGFPASLVPPSTGAQMGQPQGSVLRTYPLEQGRSIPQSTSSQYAGKSGLPASFVTPASGFGTQMGQPHGSFGFGWSSPAQAGMKHKGGRQEPVPPVPPPLVPPDPTPPTPPEPLEAPLLPAPPLVPPVPDAPPFADGMQHVEGPPMLLHEYWLVSSIVPLGHEPGRT